MLFAKLPVAGSAIAFFHNLMLALSYVAEIGMQEEMHQSQQLKRLHPTCSDS